jgi:diguanylate cyclase (GGDEF)-like protein
MPERIYGIGMGALVAPAIVAVLLLLLFSYLHRQTRDPFFGIWKVAAVLYAASFALSAASQVLSAHPAFMVLSHLLFVAVALAALVSTRMLGGGGAHFSGSDAALGLAGAAWVGAHHMFPSPYLPAVEVGIAGVLVFCAVRFFRHGRRRDLVSFRLAGASLATWALVLVAGHWNDAPHVPPTGVDYLLASLPLVVLGVSMLMVLLENERRVMQENLLAFSSLDVDTSRLLSAAEMEPVLLRMLGRLMGLVSASGGVLCVADTWRDSLPSVVFRLSPEFLHALESRISLEFLAQMANGRGGLAVITGAGEPGEGMGAPGQAARMADLRRLLAQERAGSLTVLTLQTREREMGLLALAHPEGWSPASSQARLLLALGMQIAMTLENYVLMDQAQRRTREHELLNQIGQAISSRLDPEEVLRTIYTELGRLFDTRTFYVAFQEGDEVHFELLVDDGEMQPKRRRKASNGLTEHIIRTGQPLLIRTDIDAVRARLGAAPMGARPARSFCGVPILINQRPAGVMAALNYDREGVYTERDLSVMQTAAGQVSVAIENARLFAQEQRRARHLGFLNTISRAAISTHDAEQMLTEIVTEVQTNFRFEHIGIGLLHYGSKEMEIKAEAGTGPSNVGKRIPLGTGAMARVVRSGEMVLLQGGQDPPAGLLPGCRSLLCIPITYGQKLMGVLNVESTRENAFAQQEVLILRTLADLLATALHNSMVLQRLQQQSITDGLTGIKTRRFFLEALQSEWKRAARSGRPFSVVLIDLDKFKEVNDTAGHLEGDLVLARVGRLLEQKCRQSNVVARYGGDEFVILMPETTVEQAQVLSERLRLWLATDPLLHERGITGSFGVATFPLHGATVEDIIRVADAGMYVSKHAGGNRVSTAEELAEAESESTMAQKQVISAYMQRFVESEGQGPGSVDELVAMLRRMGASLKGAGGEHPLRDAVAALARAAETREAHATGHTEAVTRYVEAMGRELGMGEKELDELVYAARVHDIGKIVIPESVLNKASELDAEEMALIRTHPAVGAQILEALPESASLRQYVQCHHEHLDGSGYPNGLQGEEIPLGARILAVAEAYVDMRTERPYAAARTPAEAATELESVSGVQLDGMLVRILLRQLKQEKVGRVGG